MALFLWLFFYGSFIPFCPFGARSRFAFLLLLRSAAFLLYIYLIGWSSFLTITACRKNGYEIIFIVGNSHFTERKMATTDQFPSLGCNDACTGSTNECDIGCRRDREGSVTVGGSSKSEICQRKKNASLYTATGIQMSRFDAYPGSCIAL